MFPAYLQKKIREKMQNATWRRRTSWEENER